jgi:hypothetical protein
MKNERILSCLGEISGEYIEDAVPRTREKRKTAWGKWCAIAACLTLVVVLGAVIMKPSEPVGNYSSSDQANFACDSWGINEAVGRADFVFVGTVVQNNGTRYESDDMPFTDYTIIVEQNIKGNLITGEPIPVSKEGGISKDKSQVKLFASDLLPEEGKTYIFSVYVEEDGALLISGPDSNVPLDSTSEENDALISKYVDAVENQVEYDITRYDTPYAADN